MAMSEACMRGIEKNGSRWKHEIRLGRWPAELGLLNDANNEGRSVDDKEVERVTLKIVAAVRATVKRFDWAQATDLDVRAEELECVADCGLDEVNFALGELYDSFDYWRILVDTRSGAQGDFSATAKAMSARQSQDPQGLGPKDASAVPQAFAPTPSPNPEPNHD